MNAIWFSRHQPTKSQLDEISAMGYTLVALPLGIELGSENIESIGHASRLVCELAALCYDNDAQAVFGVFATPMLGLMYSRLKIDEQIPCFAAFNISRSIEGQKPTFEHKQWLQIGML